mgnify:CR=1 FL=1
MQVITTKAELTRQVAACRRQGKTIGFVPTMGALHAGHGQLIQRACSENEVCFVSVFVNPTQFNNAEDLIKYPRNLEKDTEYLTRLGVHFVFAPSAEEIKLPIHPVTSKRRMWLNVLRIGAAAAVIVVCVVSIAAKSVIIPPRQNT